MRPDACIPSWLAGQQCIRHAAIWSLKLTRFNYQHLDSTSPVLVPAYINIHFPLLLEDPFWSERKHRMLEEFADMRQGPSSLHLAGPTSSLGWLADNKATATSIVEEEHHPLASVFMGDASLVPNVHCKSWEEAASHGVRFKSLVMPGVGGREGAYLSVSTCLPVVV